MKLPVTKTPIQARYSDTDALGHISSSSYINYMEVGRAEFFYALAKDASVPYSAVVNINVDYVSEVIFGEDISVTSWCSRVGNKSMSVCNEVYAGDRLALKGVVTVVGFDPETRQSVTLPDDWEPSDYPK